MNTEELHTIISHGESVQIEFKRSTGQRTEGAKSVCAMLNSEGGFLLFGVTDNGVLIGQQSTAETIAKVVAELRRIDPPIPLEPEVVKVSDERNVIAIRVPRGGDAPYTYDGRPYVRRGPTTNVMLREEYDRLVVERQHPVHRWELQYAEHLSLEHLDHVQILRTVEEGIRRGRLADPGTREVTELLVGMGLMRDGKILNAAVALFGRSDYLLPNYTQLLLRLARFQGSAKGNFIDNRQEYGNAFDHFQLAQEFMRRYLPVAGRIVPNIYERIDDPLYPPEALREAVANAICHRDYSTGSGGVDIAIYDDRLEIGSTGQLHFGLTPENLTQPHPSRPWNPLMARIFYIRGIIETWGRGTLKIIELHRQAGLQLPEFEEQAGSFVVRFYSTRHASTNHVKQDLSPIQEDILRILANGKPLSVSQIGALLVKQVPRRTLHENLSLLRQIGLVDLKGRGRGAFWRIL